MHNLVDLVWTDWLSPQSVSMYSPEITDKGDKMRKNSLTEKYHRIGEAAKSLDVNTSVLRFWEEEFSQLRPHRTPKGQRLYTDADMEMLGRIKNLLYEQGMTIDGARKVLSGKSQSPAAYQAEPAADPAISASQNSRETVLREAVHELEALRSLLKGSAQKAEPSVSFRPSVRYLWPTLK